MTLRRALLTSAAALIAATGCIALAGCSTPQAQAPAAPTPTATSAPAPERYVPDTGAAGEDIASWDSQLEAARVAEETMTAFVDRSQSEQEWWSAFSEHLTAEARHLWEGTDPRLVPASELTGPPAVTTVISATQVFVSVPTDAGAYELELIRHASPGAGQGPWTVQTITPPETGS